MLVAHNVRHVVVCPGSRNAALVHNFNECPDIECHPVTDERSAAFIALGISQQTRRIVAVCVTSGSALLNTLPGVAEATYQHHGIVVISADRPARWIDQLDGQTLPQPGALGTFVGKSVTLPEPHNDDEQWYCSRLINEALLTLKSDTRPSVHINVPISEPLFSFTTPKLPTVKAIQRVHWADDMEHDYAIHQIFKAKHPLIVIGQMPDGRIEDDVLDTLSHYFPTLYEPLAGELPPCPTDEMLRAIEDAPKKYLPDTVLYFGRNTVSKRLRHFLRSLSDKINVIMVNRHGNLEDISQHTSLIIVGNETRILGELSTYINTRARCSAFAQLWLDLKEQTLQQIASAPLDFSADLAVRLFEQERTEDDIVCYANSTAIRLAARHARHYCHCNRGLNGIEGSLSTAAGMSLVADGNVYCVIGDLSFFYDQNALWQQELSGNLRILLLNNGGGAIFNTLPGLEKSPVHNTFVAAQHNTSAKGICEQFNIEYKQATNTINLQSAIQWLRTSKSERPKLLEVIL